MTIQHIQIGYFRYSSCRYADQIDPWIESYTSLFSYYTWTTLSNEPFPSPTLLIQAGENVSVYSGVGQIKSALKTHVFFQFNHSYLHKKLIK
jgi:hypothetical protein